MKMMFLSKRARPDINPGVCFLTTRVKDPNVRDWDKLMRLLKYLIGTKEDILTLEADDFQELKWSIDAAFVAHPDMKSHTGSTFTMGKGAICSSSIKQKTNSRSSTESELIALDDIISKVLWTKRFVESQGFKVLLNVVYQDNTSTIKLAENGKASSGKRTRHFDIKYFYITDLIARDEVKIKYCPTEDMEADYMSKPTVEKKFSRFREIIMNLNTKS